MNQMTTPDHKDWELINAYADGELPAETRAALERRLAASAALAASLEEIQALKGNLALIRPVTVDRPSSRSIQGLRRFVRAIRIPAAAAAALALLTLGVVQLSQLSSVGDWRDFSSRLHEELSGNAYILGPASPVAAISTGAMGDLSAFDLSASRLTLVDVRNVRADGMHIVAMHYRGHNGCSLTIAVTSTASSELPSWRPAGRMLKAQWSAGASRYLVMASGMDRSRFEAIAAYAHAESMRRDSRERLRVAVRSATDQARPCA